MRFNHAPRTRRQLAFKIVGVIMSIIAAVTWLASVVTLFCRWGLNGFIRYDSDDGEVVYISNVGAKYKDGLILGTVTTGISYFLAALFTKLYYDSKVWQLSKRIVSLVSVIFVFTASVSLILLSILDSINYKAAHYTFVALFIKFTLLSAILNIIYRFQTTQFNWVLGIRALVIGLHIPLIITFIVMSVIGEKNDRENLRSVAASIEWSLAIVFILYLASFALDLLFYNYTQ